MSNNGRLINNLRKNWYFHNTDKPKKDNKRGTHFTLTTYSENSPDDMWHMDRYLDDLVAEHFLDGYSGNKRVWHIDGDVNNCYYKNLVLVSSEEYRDLLRGSLTVNELGRQQNYIQYITVKGNNAYSIWHGIYNRCYNATDPDYDGSYMCEEWRGKKHGKDNFAEWYNSQYYECDGESMAVDKDLLFPGNKEYAPDKCCLLPQTLNTMLSNCKKHYFPRRKYSQSDLPLGIRYDNAREKYYAVIKPCVFDLKPSRLPNYWNTPEEAFAEYKRFKEADIVMMAFKFKDKIPIEIYNALLKVEVKPY